MALFVIVGKNEPVYEAELGSGGGGAKVCCWLCVAPVWCRWCVGSALLLYGVAIAVAAVPPTELQCNANAMRCDAMTGRRGGWRRGAGAGAGRDGAPEPVHRPLEPGHAGEGHVDQQPDVCM